jgi:hypothetical protein
MEIMIKNNDVRVVNDEEVSTYQNKGYEALVTDMGFRKHPEYIEWDVFNHLDTVYPLTIKADRYSGAYSGGKYTAWPCGEEDIPDGVFMDDVTCAHEWGVIKSERQHVGIGCTPSVALVDLYLKEHSIFVEDYLMTVKHADDGIIITPLNERPIKIDFNTARKIAELMTSKAGAKADAVTDNERVTDIAEMEEEPYNSLIDPAWYTMRLDELDLENAALMVSSYVSDYDSDLDTGILETEGGMLVVDVINKKTHESDTVFWNDDETFRVSFKERLLRVLRKLTT